MSDNRYAVTIFERSIPDAFAGKQFKQRWKYFRFKWIARLYVAYTNYFGVGTCYKKARLDGWTF